MGAVSGVASNAGVAVSMDVSSVPGVLSSIASGVVEATSTVAAVLSSIASGIVVGTSFDGTYVSSGMSASTGAVSATDDLSLDWLQAMSPKTNTKKPVVVLFVMAAVWCQVLRWASTGLVGPTFDFARRCDEVRDSGGLEGIQAL